MIGSSSTDTQAAASQISAHDVRDAYARWAPIYDMVFNAILRPGRRAAADIINSISGKILDVGVGTGLELPMFETHTRITGIDLSEPMLNVARARVEQAGLQHIDALLVMDAQNLTFPNEHFDAVVAPYVLSVVPDPARTLDELARVVKKGGDIILVNHIGSETGFLALCEGLLARASAILGWDPHFAWAHIGNWLSANKNCQLIEKRRLKPLNLFTLTHIKRIS
jgi:phosphatidylethanolamine/phosphatidyl-N-methylethanolamine N-methyltransferase